MCGRTNMHITLAHYGSVTWCLHIYNQKYPISSNHSQTPIIFKNFNVLMKISISMIQSVVCMHYYFVRQSLTREWYDSNWSVERGQGLIFHISRMKNFWSMAEVEGSVLTDPCQQCNHGRNIRQQCVQVWILKKQRNIVLF